MKQLLLILLVCSVGTVFAQRPDIKRLTVFEDIEESGTIGRQAQVSDDGKYIAYWVQNEPKGSYTLIVASTNGSWQKKLPGYMLVGRSTRFISNNRFLYGDNRGMFEIALPEGKITKSKEQFFDEYLAPAIIRKIENGGKTTIERYDFVKRTYLKVIDDVQLQIDRKLKISDADILPSGNFVLRLTRVHTQVTNDKPLVNAAKVDIWSYTDIRLQSEQKVRPEEPEIIITALFYPKTGRIDLLDDEKYTSVRAGNSEVWLLARKDSELKLWSHWKRPDFYYHYDYAISTIDGKRKRLTELDSISPKNSFSATPDGNNIGYFNLLNGSYYSYEVGSAKTRNLTDSSTGFSAEQRNNSSQPSEFKYRSLNKFDSNSPHIIAYDEFDIWEFDLTGKRKTKCLTNHYGRKNGVVLQLLGGNVIYWNSKEVLLSGVGKTTKFNGFFSFNLEHGSIPKKIMYDNVLSYMPNSGGQFGLARDVPIKAKSAQVIITTLQTTSSSPNWYALTAKGIKQLSFVTPEAKNRMTSELIKWKNKAGDSLQGILYKPSIFDATKKYPVILNYYETVSNELNLFLQPRLFNGDINIPLLVSKGYLVFRPDILYKTGHAGQSALDCITSGTDELCKRQYVNSEKIGLAGHSFGGFETLFTITHSNRYKAALAAAPPTNQISRYNTIFPGLGGANAFHIRAETAQAGTASSLWERPDIFIENSPIFNADKIQTPLLLMHNKEDRNVFYSQGLEFFLSMYRMGKPAWLLEYENETHLLSNRNNQRDYTIRVMQFFDHYLKDADAPKWMLDGVAFRDKGIKQGYELDNTGRKPGPSPSIDTREYGKIDEYSRIPLVIKLNKLLETCLDK
ncbi:S9 family peptidase [Pedobacter sp. KBS0701]|uniref:alpha/beta hydrolase family protein n=1 Tax=Pedobacter sp. KBS0701 TaxID=2578106 RepID=UPI00110E7B0E|nr:prolyl oligopeptidase family serine peptidase [Pedobacter sp. KBS0701]QDW27250.1 S9 family peptidase [Pedobacter sp. KBS0701]